MSAIIRGVKNTFRNVLRTTGFSILIAVSMSLAFSMLLANQAVRDRGQQLRDDIGAGVLLFPAGGAAGGMGKAFTDADADKLARLPHVKNVIKTMNFGAQHPDDTKKNKEQAEKLAAKNKDQQNSSTKPLAFDNQETPKTSLLSAIDPATLNVGDSMPIPVVAVTGSTGERDSEGKKFKMIEGRTLKADDKNAAVIGKTLAAKNNLRLGSTFTVKDATFTVVGIFDSESLFGNNRVAVPFAAARTILGKDGEVQGMGINADTIEDIAGVTESIKQTLGKDRVEVMPLQQDAIKFAASLKSIEQISFTTMVVSLGAGALTILLTMLLVVRERTKEIGVLKALGATNTKIVGQFLSEATVLTFIGTAIGMAFAAATSNAILQGLLEGKTGSSTSGMAGQISAGGPVQSLGDLAANLNTLVDWHFVVFGLGVAIVIALVGTAIPAFLIAKVRPAQIMRGE